MSPDPIGHLVATAREASEWLADVPFREGSRLSIAGARHAIALRQAAEAVEAHWPDDGTTVEACGAPSPRPGLSCICEPGHEGPHRNGPDRWHTITEEAPPPFRVVDFADLATRADLAEAVAGAASLAYVLGLERRIDRLAALPIADDIEHVRATLAARVRSLESRLDDLARAVGDRLSAVENLTTTVVGFTNPEEDDPQRVRLMMDSNAGPDRPRRGRWRDR